MTEKRKSLFFDVRSVRNDYYALGENGGPTGKRPEYLYYCSGPGSPGSHGYLLQSHLYFDTYEEAERAIPMLEQAYFFGRSEKLREIKTVLEIK